mmetsp:Transcript_19680/g.27141  ORF Transcript_19680/g.27141 Transcript_19680/m.27141 type:complete len:221 (+) Transcript_19680:69-731(+)|eukprot:CAMPEP_0201476648 /NCGR_PEP_ID=MMETSP0151_2-20130828/1809_1 /ASSEMBLY_ACC=CAM_ASM_000257 /TAXON_ID=200890 /ORGANISM="Paramoeba atlantica, Strain 621/1 / CCAP 1560/9" /LENGTH=220 /DNA_ID=CAMNT_0047857077 /DNA_START=61 /DNA_END=723 /DNA_ORIENTATION=+
MAAVIELFYDVISPYSYYAASILQRYSKYDPTLTVKWRPFFLGGVMNMTGNKPPMALAARQGYLAHDIHRMADWAGVSIQMPATFPVNTLPAQRLLTACDAWDDSFVPNLSFGLWRELYERDADMTSPEVFMKVCNEAGISTEDAKKLIEATKTPEVKNKLTERTKEAVERGAFGAPTIFASTPSSEPQMFFGSDRFHLLFPAIGKEWRGPFPDSPKPKL